MLPKHSPTLTVSKANLTFMNMPRFAVYVCYHANLGHYNISRPHILPRIPNTDLARMALNRLSQPVMLLFVNYRVLPGSFHNIRNAKPYRLKGKQSVTDITADIQANSLIISLRPLCLCVTLHRSFCHSHEFSMALFIHLYFSCTLILLISSSFLCLMLIIPPCTMS